MSETTESLGPDGRGDLPTQPSNVVATQSVSTQPKDEGPQQEVPEVKGFTRDEIIPAIVAPIHLPKILPNRVFTFKMRMKFSVKAEEDRQIWNNYSQAKRTETQSEQALKEVCDLLKEMPQGFADLKYDGKSLASSFYNYVTMTQNPETKEFLMLVAEGANSYYWNAIAPQEFRPKV